MDPRLYFLTPRDRTSPAWTKADGVRVSRPTFNMVARRYRTLRRAGVSAVFARDAVVGAIYIGTLRGSEYVGAEYR